MRGETAVGNHLSYLLFCKRNWGPGTLRDYPVYVGAEIRSWVSWLTYGCVVSLTKPNTAVTGGGTCYISLNQYIFPRYLVSVPYVIKLREKHKSISKNNLNDNFYRGERGLVSFYLWGRRRLELAPQSRWEPGKHTCALTIRFLKGPTQRLLPAARSTCSKQERYRNETQGKWNGNDTAHNEGQDKTMHIRVRNAHIKMKKTEWNRRKTAVV